ncbi:right-handed parallel beta-helix repeat-containing protein [Streptomyces sp. RB6PN25]|uniref:Right-handed parallel beta-helix repeat-containing protein n=1 Tax=Streptomyces humicola TaxID=2953240 RepID=A0ABT1Q2V4_9ACTN|nr:right-handed parallel beta-helix repeat-containing protein [Streptomyces humicola]MCQ4084255.1 right-handed parallel beta-helix repeat-containing protein [Streptomyces humicola]
MLAAVAATVALVVPGAAVATAAPVSPDASSGTTYYVDCSGGSDSAAGTSPNSAWKSLAMVNATTLRPGDAIRLRGGSSCAGTLAPRGSGSAAAPITIASYGSGTARIVGGGATAAVFLHNVQYYELSNLDISNEGPAPTATQQRVGIYVLLEDFGIGHHYVISNVSVHNVNGCDCRDPNSSGGILFVAGGSSVPTGFDCVHVTGDTVAHVDRTGIGTVSYWQRRSQYPNGPGTTWVPMTHLVIDGNHVSDTGGDGIMVFNGDHALIQHNVVDGYEERSADYNVGAYAWNSDYTVFQYNEVADGKSPGMAFDLEGGDTATLIQYNLSHDNGAGFLFICPSQGSVSSGGIVRYNISQNDQASGVYGVFTNPCGDEPGTQIYNNTIYAPGAANLVEVYGASTAAFTNNIFIGRPAGSVLNDPHSTYSHNIYQNVSSGSGFGSDAIQADPLLVAPGTATSVGDAGGYQLDDGSPALGAGTAITGSGAHDYFGNPIPSSDPNIGAY